MYNIIRRVIHYNRANGGAIDLGETISGVKALRITNVIYGGDDFEKGGRILRLFLHGFIKGIELTAVGPKPYTCFMDTDGEGNWQRLTHPSEWDCESGIPVDISGFQIEAWIDTNPAKNVKLMIEVELGV